MLKKCSDRILHILPILSNLTDYVACRSPKSSDAENITGLKNRTARRFLQKVKEHSRKTDLEKVTSIPEDVVQAYFVG